MKFMLQDRELQLPFKFSEIADICKIDFTSIPYNYHSIAPNCRYGTVVSALCASGRLMLDMYNPTDNQRILEDCWVREITAGTEDFEHFPNASVCGIQCGTSEWTVLWERGFKEVHDEPGMLPGAVTYRHDADATIMCVNSRIALVSAMDPTTENLEVDPECLKLYQEWVEMTSFETYKPIRDLLVEMTDVLAEQLQKLNAF